MDYIVDFDSECDLHDDDIVDFIDIDGSVDFNSENYPILINELLKYIELNKLPEDSLIDIMTQFCLSKKIDVRVLGDAVYDDEYLKAYIQKDCEIHGLLKSEYVKDLDW